jgi:signal transduction histidine kinase
VRAILEDIRSDDQRAGAVVDRMRSMMKRRPIQFSRVDVNLLATDVLGLVRSDADARKVQMTFEAAPSVPLVQGDGVQLQQVLLNLLVNAMDAVSDSAPGDRQVAVSVHPADALVVVTVKDTGRGIPADKLTRIFEPFFTTKPNGMGMGLAICSRIIVAHAGRLWAENNPDRGATFRFALPAARPQPSPA